MVRLKAKTYTFKADSEVFQFQNGSIKRTDREGGEVGSQVSIPKWFD